MLSGMWAYGTVALISAGTMAVTAALLRQPANAGGAPGAASQQAGGTNKAHPLRLMLASGLISGMIGVTLIYPLERIFNKVVEPQPNEVPKNHAEKLIGSRWSWNGPSNVSVSLVFDDWSSDRAILTVSMISALTGKAETESWALTGLSFITQSSMVGVASCSEHGGITASVAKVVRLPSNELEVQVQFDDNIERVPKHALRREKI